MEYALQLEVKGGQVREIFARELKIELAGPEVVPSPKIWGYRNRARFHILRADGEARAAYHEPGEEHAFMPTGPCFLLPDEMNALCTDVLDTMNAFEIGSITDIEVRRSAADGRMLVAFEFGPGTDVPEIRKAFAGLGDRFPVAGIVGLVTGQGGGSGSCPCRESRSFMNPWAMRASASAPARSSRSTATCSLRPSTRCAASRSPSSSRASPISIAASGPSASCWPTGRRRSSASNRTRRTSGSSGRTSSHNGVGNYAVCEGTSEEWIAEILEREVDLVIVDPPRRGLEPPVVRALAERPVPAIVYLSCNPATLARDLKGLGQAYAPEVVKVLDFFPHTPHIETLVVLRRVEP